MKRCSHHLIAAVATAVAIAAPASAQQSVELPAKDVALRDRPADVYSVGTVEGRDWEMFSDIRSLAFDRDDNLYVLDGQNYRVVVFDRSGRYVRQFGKQGGGPGELQAPFGLAITPDQHVVVSDPMNRAFILFTREGEHVRNVPFDDEVGFPSRMLSVDGGDVVFHSLGRIGPNQPPQEGERTTLIARQSLAEGEPEATTLYRMPAPPAQRIDAGGSGNVRRVAMVSMQPAFSAMSTFGVTPAGVAVHHETEYRIRLFDRSGRQVRELVRDYPLRKVTQRDKEAWQERRERAEAEGGGGARIAVSVGPGGTSFSTGRGAPPAAGREVLRMSLENTPFAEYMSVVTGIRTDPMGRIWVQRRHEDGSERGPIDLVTADGRYIGTLPPQPLPDAVSASGLAAWRETDELGVEKVVVRRLPASWQAARSAR